MSAASSAPSESRAALLSLLTGSVIWGFTWWPLKHFHHLGLDGHAIALTAYALLGVVSLPFIWRQRAQWRREWHWLLVIGLCFGLANFLLTWALMVGSVVRVMLLFFLLPAWGVMGGRLLLHEALGWRRALAVVPCLCGVFILVGGVRVFDDPPSLADLAALVAGIAYTGAGITNRVAVEIPIASRTLMSFVGSTVLAVAGLALHVPEIPVLAALDWLRVCLFAFVWLLGASLLTTYGVTHVPASRAGVLQVLELVVAVGSAVLIGGEALSAGETLGGAMILVATLIEAYSPPDAASTAPT